MPKVSKQTQDARLRLSRPDAAVKSASPREKAGAKTPSLLSRRKLLIQVILVALAVGYIVMSRRAKMAPSSAAPGSTAAVAPAGHATAAASDAPAMSLAVLETFTAAVEETWPLDMKVDATGRVFLLKTRELCSFVGGKPEDSLPLPVTKGRSMAWDGHQLYLTDFTTPRILRISPQLEELGSFTVKGAKYLSGIAWSPSNERLFVCESSGETVYVLDNHGKRTGSFPGPTKAGANAQARLVDLQVDKYGNLHFLDVYDNSGTGLTATTPGGQVIYRMALPFPAPFWERAAMGPGQIYIACFRAQRLIGIDTPGKYFGQMPLKNPALAAAGEDGFIYVWADNKILKMRP
jgi:hypothetical protein